ncbi:uncharacterized protein LOC109504180 isoform X1 [Harpegnathos saltator]|uniref:uncharacterized protein LOC109504180 isoform X1 n=1 Tax=Harpegnathos saltator TaxID=610380 RepID=UPI000DBEDEBD|nr:uncharacterized protein LOC109504180 isoform X1 [Harpegnathos saltator]
MINATHALVFMLGGIFTRWKIPVANHFTPNSVDGAILKPIVETIIAKAEAIGLYVHSITSDMGPLNLGMWRAFGGIIGNRYSKIKNSIVHPIDHTRRLFFMADVPHLLKYLRASSLNNKVIELPIEFVQAHNLSQPVVKCQHLLELIEIQENLELKLIPKLKKSDMMYSTFNKMKVNKATHIWSRDVSSAIYFYAEENKKTEFNTTAAFVEIVSKWFTLATSRTSKVALGKTASDENIQIKFNDNIAFLKSVVELFREIKIGHDAKFKPVQSGVMITTTSLIELTQFLIDERKYVYVLTSRFTQDCLENLFSSIRVKHPVPTALQFKQNLKLIAISQYLQSPHTSSYEKDDGQIIGDFFNKPKIVNDIGECTQTSVDILHVLKSNSNISLDNIELNVLFNIAGYIISSIAICTNICSKCLLSVGSKTYNPIQKYNKFVQLRCFRAKT